MSSFHTAATEATYHFADMTLDLARGLLRGTNGEIELRPKSFNVLRYLVGNAGRVVTKSEIMRAIWPDMIVTDDSLSRCISDIRLAIGDREATIIKTMPKRGYRFEAIVTTSAARARGNPAIPSIAVLPFQNLNGDANSDYFADGVVEEITVALSRFKPLLVISRNSSFSYKGRLVETSVIGSELGVRYVLQGSVRKAGERVRVSGQLIEAATGFHLWANTFDGDLANFFILHEDIARSVVGAIVPRLLEAEIEISRRKPVQSWTAYDHYLRAAALLRQPSPAAVDEATDHLKQALVTEADFALALATLSACEVVRRFFFGREPFKAEYTKAFQTAERAAELAPDDDRSLALCASFFAFMTDDLERALVLAERAIDLNPNHAFAWTVLGWTSTWLGDVVRARAAFDTAIRLNPLDRQALVQILPGYIVICFVSGLHEERLGWATRLLALDPVNLSGLLSALDVETIRQRTQEAAAFEARLRAAYPALSAADIGQIFKRYRKAEHQVVFDEYMKRLPLSNRPLS
jgi:TolB-like protein/tetratricopeptide (TPR) repeat protein